jgi:hypothetical protein
MDYAIILLAVLPPVWASAQLAAEQMTHNRRNLG